MVVEKKLPRNTRVRSLELFFSVCLLELPTTPPRLVYENTEAHQHKYPLLFIPTV